MLNKLTETMQLKLSAAYQPEPLLVYTRT